MLNEYKNKIVSFYQKNKRMPSYSEMMKIFDFKSKNAVYRLVNKMIDVGIISKDNSGRLVPDKIFGEIPMLGTIKSWFPSSFGRKSL
jgi:SOS-response transcriptional repressor LexA